MTTNTLQDQKRAFIYVRQSIGHPEGIDRALIRCREMVARRGWVVAREFQDDNISATKSRGASTDWAKMLDAIATKEADVIVGVDLDRLVRSIGDLGRLIGLGVTVVTVDGEIDLTSADGELRATILAGMARFEVRRKSERQARANLHRVQSGKAIPGRRRYGFETDGMTLIECEARQVRALFERFRDGASIRSLAAEMGWRNVRLRDTLTNPAYVGRLKHHGIEYDAPGIVPTVSAELFEQVGAMLADPSRRTSPGSAYVHLLSGIARCGVCTRTLVRMADYRCPESAQHVSIQQKTLDREVLAQVAHALTSAPRSAFDQPGEVQRLAMALADVIRRQDDLVTMLDNGLPRAQAATKMRALSDERTAIDDRIVEARAKTSTMRLLADLSTGLWDAPSDPYGDAGGAHKAVLEAFGKYGLEERRELVRGLLDITVMKGRGLDRIEIWHKVAMSLNDPEEVARREAQARSLDMPSGRAGRRDEAA